MALPTEHKQMYSHALIVLDEDDNEIIDPAGKRRSDPVILRPSEQKKMRNGGAPWRLVEVVDHHIGYDKEIFRRWGPDYEILPDRVREHYRLEAVPNAREILEARLDNKAEEARAAMMRTHGVPPLQLQEYLYAIEQAKSARDLAATEARPIVKGEFPMLDADVGVSVNRQSNKVVKSPLEAAALILDKSEVLQRDLANIRAQRLAFKKKMRAIEDIHEVLQLVEDAEFKW